MSAWKAALIDAPTQAGKTKKCLEFINNKLADYVDSYPTLTVFITQANSTYSVEQLQQRVSVLENVDNIYTSQNTPNTIDNMNQNHMLIDYWNSRNTKRIIKFANNTKDVWKNVIVIIDEADQGNLDGVRNRISFLSELDDICKVDIKPVFITATVPNFSKQIYQISKENNNDISKNRILYTLIHSKHIEHFYASPGENYIGASWYERTDSVWRPLVFPRRLKKDEEQNKMTKEEERNEIILKELNGLPDKNKRLTLFAVSNLIEYHNCIAPRILQSGYNVAIKMNNSNGKNYIIIYNSTVTNTYKEWCLPYKELDIKLSRSPLSPAITCRYDYTMAHVLNSTLFANCDDDIYKYHIFDYKPDDFPKPEDVRACLITGNMASRGITFQNPSIGFVCTSYCLTDLKDSSTRGASSTQRFGRACGMLMDNYNTVKPILIASENILKSAIANELALRECSRHRYVCLKDMIPAMEWKSLCANVKQHIYNRKQHIRIRDSYRGGGGGGDIDNDPIDTIDIIDGVSTARLCNWLSSSNKMLVARMVQYLYTQEEVISFDMFMQGIDYEGSDKDFRSNVDSGRSVRCNYGKLWCVRRDTVILNPNIRYYIKNRSTN